MIWKALSVKETNFYKGIAILLIAIHNYMHMLPGMNQNEFSFNYAYFEQSLNLAWSQPSLIIQLFFTYFGHYGVQVFIFFSAYGLVKRYEGLDIEYFKFIKKRILKIYIPFIIVLVLWSLYGFIEYGALGPAKVVWWNWQGIVAKLLLVSNFMVGYELQPVGPWWFIPFIAQFYLIFPLLLRGQRKYGSAFLLCIAMIGYVIVNIPLPVNILYFPFGHLPEICLGMFIAGRDKTAIKFPLILVLIIPILIYLVNLNQLLWSLSPLVMLAFFLILTKALMNMLNASSKAKNVIEYVGEISMFIFLLNGFLRYPLIDWAISNNIWYFSIISAVLFIFQTIIFSVLMQKIEVLVSIQIRKIRFLKSYY